MSRDKSYKNIKFVDQTNDTIKLLRNGRHAIPGTSVFSTKRKRTRKETDDDTELSDGQILNMPLIFEQEMPLLIRSPGSYGFQSVKPVAAETFNFNDNTSPSYENTQSPPRGSVEEYDEQNEFRLIMYYSRTMCQYYTLKSTEWNIYSFIGNRLACQYEPLKKSILAWTSIHLSQLHGTSTHTAQQYFRDALTAVMKEEFTGERVHVDLLLTTCFFLLLYDIAIGTKHAREILRHVWSKIHIGKYLSGGQGSTSSTPKLTPYGYQILSFLLHIDIRSALFSGNISFPDYITTDSSNPPRDSNIEYLTTSRIYNAQASEMARLTEGVGRDFGSAGYPANLAHDDQLIDHILVITMRNVMNIGRIVRLRNWLNQCGNSTEFDSDSLRVEIDELVRVTEELHDTLKDKQLLGSNVQYTTLICKSLAYSSVILFDRVILPTIRTNDHSQKAAAEIIKIATIINSMRQGPFPRSLLWPFPLLIAGIETTDPIYQAWVERELTEYDSYGWGVQIQKALCLFRECIQIQAEEGVRVDIAEVMTATTGEFIL